MSELEKIQIKYAEEAAKRSDVGDSVTFREPAVADMDKDIYLDGTASTQQQQQQLSDGSEVTVLIIGAGYHGLITAHRLITEGGCDASEVVLIDKAGGWGGTWYWNRYPGVACDVEGFCYLPLLGETRYKPSQRYPLGHEIREHCCRIASQFQLRGQFSTTVTHQRWDDDAKRWIVSMTTGSQLPGEVGGTETPLLRVRAQFVVCAGGIFASPRIPKLNGIDAFRSNPAKTLMHTARWDWSLSGGGGGNGGSNSPFCPSSPDMALLAGKRVGVVGSGATAVQVLPHVARCAGHTYSFQRTPAYVGPHRQGRVTREMWDEVTAGGGSGDGTGDTEEEEAEQDGKKKEKKKKKGMEKPGWQYDRMRNYDMMLSERRAPGLVDAIRDGWTTAVPALSALLGSTERLVNGDDGADVSAHVASLLADDTTYAEALRRRVDDEVPDADTADRLKAWYPVFCKRPAFSENYLAVFNDKERVTLVDSPDGRGVTAYTANGVVAGGREYELDVLVLATGYLVTVFDTCPETSINAPIVGRRGRSLRKKWDGASDDDGGFGALYGLASHGFPNLFYYSMSGSGVSNNAPSSLTTNARAIAKLVREARAGATEPSKVVVEATREAEKRYAEQVAERATWFAAMEKCAASAFVAGGKKDQDDDGDVEAQRKKEAEGKKRTHWGGGVVGWQRLMDQWRESEGVPGFQISG